MKKMRIALLLVGVLLGFTKMVHAEPDYTAEQIISFLTSSARSENSSGICIGTVEECAAKTAKPAGFDLLVEFEHNSVELSSNAKENLEQIAKAINDQRLSTATFTIEGNTDAYGTDEFNQDLSERRARAVVNFLSERGVEATKLSAVGLGESNPRMEDFFDPANRRVEINIDPK